MHDDRSAFDPLRLLHILHKYPITTLCAPPTAYRQLVLQKSKRFLKENPPKALSHCTGAGEPLNAGVIDEWQRMTDMKIFDGYGQTETVLTCGNFAGTAIRPGSMGKPTLGVPLKIISSDGLECEPEKEGDLAILVNESSTFSSEEFFGLFDGYIRPDGSLDKRIKELGGKEWYLTGDRATRDKDGYYWFVGRADDVINSAGYRIGIPAPFITRLELVIDQSGRSLRSRVNIKIAFWGRRISSRFLARRISRRGRQGIHRPHF